jgi:outer membrane receptor for monomeric catechols
MPAAVLRMIALMAFCLCDAAFAMAPAQSRHTPANAPDVAARSANAPVRSSRAKHHPARPASADAYVDPANPYKANRLSSPRASEPISNIPGQTTVLTREMLDDKNATSVRGALGSVAGVTIGR